MIKVGIEAIGSSIKIYLDGLLVADLTDTNLTTNKSAYIGMSSSGVGQSVEFQYIVYQPI